MLHERFMRVKNQTKKKCDGVAQLRCPNEYSYDWRADSYQCHRFASTKAKNQFRHCLSCHSCLCMVGVNFALEAIRVQLG